MALRSARNVTLRALDRVSLLAPSYRAYEWLREAMACYEKAETLRAPNNDDALLRWNACARLIMADDHLAPISEERGEPLFLE